MKKSTHFDKSFWAYLFSGRLKIDQILTMPLKIKTLPRTFLGISGSTIFPKFAKIILPSEPKMTITAS